jgi:AbrB family looped-hinge helix DNA binding protein
MEVVTVKTKFQIVIPQRVREQAQVEIGDILEARVENGKIVLTPKSLIDRHLVEGIEHARQGRTHGGYATAEAAVKAPRDMPNTMSKDPANETSVYEQAGMAAGYASFRPPVHRKILERALPPGMAFHTALDVGCGAGVSTQALAGFVDFAIGMEPVAGMLPKQPGFFAGAAEAIPVRHDSIYLMTAAGSLNYADVNLFFPEAARVLRPGGLLVVYDFEPGRTFPNSGRLDHWFRAFIERYPWPPHEGGELNPEILCDLAAGFRLTNQECFEIAIPLAREFYLEYMLTETNVASALRRGAPREEIRSWCARTLDAFWKEGAREILFRGYYACLAKT